MQKRQQRLSNIGGSVEGGGGGRAGNLKINRWAAAPESCLVVPLEGEGRGSEEEGEEGGSGPP